MSSDGSCGSERVPSVKGATETAHVLPWLRAWAGGRAHGPSDDGGQRGGQEQGPCAQDIAPWYS
jgi:hypothetical protein